MSAASYSHDTGLFTLQLPAGWVFRQQGAGTLLVQDPQEAVSLALVAVAATLDAPPRVDALDELQKWIATQKNVQVNEVPHLLAPAPYAVAVAQGVQAPRRAERWYYRFLPGHQADRGTSLWRFWAIVNPHLLILASASGAPADMEGCRADVDGLIASIRLPERQLLVGRRFTEQVIALSRSWFPKTPVAAIDESHLQFGAQHVSLVKLHRRYLAAPEEFPNELRTLLAAAIEELPASVAAGSWPDARVRIVPVILTAVARSTNPRGLHNPWVNSLSIGYTMEMAEPVNDAPVNREVGILLEDLRRWHVDAEELHAHALKNLAAQPQVPLVSEGQGAVGRGGRIMLGFARPDRHSAARLLVPELQQKLRQRLGATFLAAIPTRDVLMSFALCHTEDRAAIRREVEAAFCHAQPGLSHKLFLVTPDGIAGDPDATDL